MYRAVQQRDDVQWGLIVASVSPKGQMTSRRARSSTGVHIKRGMSRDHLSHPSWLDNNEVFVTALSVVGPGPGRRNREPQRALRMDAKPQHSEQFDLGICVCNPNLCVLLVL